MHTHTHIYSHRHRHRHTDIYVCVCVCVWVSVFLEYNIFLYKYFNCLLLCISILRLPFISLITFIGKHISFYQHSFLSEMSSRLWLYSNSPRRRGCQGRARRLDFSAVSFFPLLKQKSSISADCWSSPFEDPRPALSLQVERRENISYFSLILVAFYLAILERWSSNDRFMYRSHSFRKMFISLYKADLSIYLSIYLKF